MLKLGMVVGTMSLLIPLLPSEASEPIPPKPFVIKLEIPPPQESEGGMIVADVDNNGAMDYLVTAPGHLAVYSNDGQKLWVKQTDLVVGGQSESRGLPGHHGPGVAAGDVDGDGKCEVIFLTKDRVLHFVDGATGKEEANAKPPVPKGAERWELAMIASFQGKGDQDILLQATNRDGYRTGRYLAAYTFGVFAVSAQKVDATRFKLAKEVVEMRLTGVDGPDVSGQSGTRIAENAFEGERGEKESADGDGWRGDDGERFPVVPRHPVVGSRC